MPAFINKQVKIMTNPTVAYFDRLSADEILQEVPGKWSDDDLLHVLEMFSEMNDTERETAVLELILSSPENSPMVDYDELFSSLIHDSYLNNDDFEKATYWTIAALAHAIQLSDPINVRNLQRTLVEIYLRQGDVASALQITTRLLQTDPGDLWTHNTLALFSAKVSQPDLIIAALERALELAKENDPDDLKPQLKKFYEQLVTKEKTAVSAPQEINPATLAQFYEVLTLPPLPADTEPARYLPPITDLLNQGETLDETLQQTIITQWKVLIPELLQAAFDEEYWGTAVNRHAISLLHQIHKQEPALDSLSHWLNQATDENWYLLLGETIGKIGGFTTPELQTIISNTDLDTLVRSSAAETLVERLETMSEQRDDIINYCRFLLTREEAYTADEEMFIALLISAIIDQDAKELYPEIKQVFDEDRLDPTILDLPYIHEEWDMTPLPPEVVREDGLYLTLECTKCHRIRRHFVQHVTIDITTLNAELEGEKVPYDPNIMDRPIVCPKCGAIDQYQPDTMTKMRLVLGNKIENMMAVMTGETPQDTTPDPFISQVRPQAFGQDMHPLVALDKYKQLARRNPKQAEPHWRMGNILRMLWRDEQAREAYQRSLELDPDENYTIYSLAATEHDLGNFEEARKLYQEIVHRISPLAMLQDEELLALSISAADGLKALKKGRPSPYSQEFRQPKTEQERKKLSRREKQQQKKKNKRR
jgi:tetratricopeptide (TPR) repeat protein